VKPPTEVLGPLLASYAGILLVNVTLSAIMWATQRTALHRTLFFFWAAGVLSFAVQGLASEGKLTTTLGFSTTFLVNLILAYLIAEVCHVRMLRRRAVGIFAVGLVATLTLAWTPAPFWLLSLPTVLAVSWPLFDTGVRALRHGGDELTVSNRSLIVSSFIFGAHNIDFAFLRDKPEMAQFGFIVALIVVIALSVTAHAVVLERETRSRTRIEQLNQFQKQFFSNVTHELRTPLTMIILPIEAILAGKLGQFSEEQTVYFSAIHRNAIKLLKLINDLLDLAKLEEARLRLRPLATDLPSYLARIVEHVKPLADRKSLAVTLEVSPTPQVFVDPDLFERVMVNLLANAIKFTSQGGVTVRLRTTEAGGVQIDVSDTGIGIPRGQLEEVFDRFSQVEGDHHRSYGGTGIGLALAKHIVELHGGRITASSTPGEGTTLTVALAAGTKQLPSDAVMSIREQALRQVRSGELSLEDGVPAWTEQLLERKDYRYLEIDELTERRAVHRREAGEIKKHTVLLCEDNRDMLQFIYLNLQEAFSVITATDGEQGWKLVQQHQPDLVVTDLMMPGVDGLELCRRIKRDQATHTIPVILLTALSDVEDRIRGKEVGADEYIGKPFDPAEMLAVARQLLSARGAVAQHAVEQRLESLDIISAGIAHEIRNPLNQIKNGIGVIVSTMAKVEGLVGANGQPIGAGDREILQQARTRVRRMEQVALKGVERISNTVDLMSEYARHGNADPASLYDLDELVSSVLNLVGPREDKEVRVTGELSSGAKLHCARGELLQAITNVVQNAIDAVPDGGSVRVRSWRRDSVLYLSVQDDGPGMDRTTLEKIFSPFFSTKGPGGGMGLGLTITQRMVKRAQGELEVKSEPGKGTEFVLSFPEARDHRRAARATGSHA